MPLTNEELEALEKTYLSQLYFHLKSNETRLMAGLRSKDNIRGDWWEQFQQGGKATDLDRGSERIFYWLLSGIWIPNSAPIGSDLFFESHDAFIHIEIKTSEIDNRGDYFGLTPISRKQTSYPLWRIDKPPGLPIYYRKGKSDEKPCLTFAIHIIHDPETLDIIAILLLSIPNGQLYELYGDGIVGGGKVKGDSFRYRYKDAPFFKSLPNKPHRVRIVYFDEKSGQSKKDITALELED